MLVDIHHHLLYSVDDGPQTIYETHKLLLRAQAEGVSHIIATPNAFPGEAPFPAGKCQEGFLHVQALCRQEGIPIQVYPGAEIFYTESTLRALKEGQIPTLAGTKYVLVEFLPDAKFTLLCDAARRLGSVGYLPIYAHVERYRCLRKLRNLELLHDEYQVLTQINAHTVLRKCSYFEDRWMRGAIESGWIDIAASDAHNSDTRSCRLGQCFRELGRRFGDESAQRMCIQTPGKILGLT